MMDPTAVSILSWLMVIIVGLIAVIFGIVLVGLIAVLISTIFSSIAKDWQRSKSSE